VIQRNFKKTEFFYIQQDSGERNVKLSAKLLKPIEKHSNMADKMWNGRDVTRFI